MNEMPIMESINSIIAGVAVILTAASSILAWFQARRAKKKGIEAQDLQFWLELSENTLHGVVAALEVAPSGSTAAQVKQYAKKIASELDTQGPKLEKTVKQIEELFSAWQLTGKGTLDADNLSKISQAVKVVRATRADQPVEYTE